ncbi:hypothetical protein HMPREF0653_00116 [Prevotella disiens JCM 6334 = ATCC 29426]|uniref:Uncharacterized protein n=1 Tax=Prevotella disiens JCM 6334 = ATCC 29426 TaxID=1235811 RepID=A0ABP2YB30_9BACT|nr:hypothetical protein HMPREF0653_00116 [Prevotella disiens JCM 6334 = ATCC 29426]
MPPHRLEGGIILSYPSYKHFLPQNSSFPILIHLIQDLFPCGDTGVSL